MYNISNSSELPIIKQPESQIKANLEKKATGSLPFDVAGVSNVMLIPSSIEACKEKEEDFIFVKSKRTMSESIQKKNEKYETKNDGACLFRAYLAYKNGDPSWLNEKKLDDIYDWVIESEETFVNAINEAFESGIYFVESNCRTSRMKKKPVFEEEDAFNKLNEKIIHLHETNFAVELLKSCKLKRKFNLWNEHALQMLLEKTLSCKIKTEYCEMLTDKFHELLIMKFNIPIKEGCGAFIQLKKQHYSLLAPKDFFNEKRTQQEETTLSATKKMKLNEGLSDCTEKDRNYCISNLKMTQNASIVKDQDNTNKHGHPSLITKKHIYNKIGHP